MHLHQSFSKEVGATSAVTNTTTLLNLLTPFMSYVYLMHTKIQCRYLFHESVCEVLDTIGTIFGEGISY